MKPSPSFLAVVPLFAALVAITGCGSTSDLVDDGKAVADISVTPDMTKLSKGTSLQLHAMLEYADGTSKDVTDSRDTVWNTSDPDIATVSEDGVVTGVGMGVVDVSALYKGELKDNEHFAVTP